MKKVNSPTTVVTSEQMPETKTTERSLFIKVDTIDADNQVIGERIVDMYHVGTRNWLLSHNWWAMHNAHIIETRVATPVEVEAYIAAKNQELVAKFAPKAA